MKVDSSSSTQSQPSPEDEYQNLISSLTKRNFWEFKSILNKNRDLIKHTPNIIEYLFRNGLKEDLKFIKLLISVVPEFSHSSFFNYFVRSHLSEEEMLELIDTLVDLGQTEILFESENREGITQKLFQTLNFTQIDYHIDYHTVHASNQTYSKVFNRLFQLGGCSHGIHPFREFFENQHKPISTSRLKAFTDQLDLEAKDPEGRTWVASIMDRCQPNDFELLLVVRNLLKRGAEVPALDTEHAWFKFLKGLSGPDLEFVEICLTTIDPNRTVLIRDVTSNPWNSGPSERKFKEVPRQYPKLKKMIETLSLPELGQLLIGKEAEKLFKITPLPLLTQKLKEIFPTSSEDVKRAIFELVSKFNSQSLLKELVIIALENKADPLSKLTESDPRSLLKVLIDSSNTADFTSDLHTLWPYITLSSDQLRDHFPEGNFLAYKLEQTLRFSQETLFKFALQSSSLPQEKFLPDLNTPEKTVSSEGSLPGAIYPYITLYLEEFLYNLEGNDLDNSAIKEILQVFLFNSAESNVNESHLQLSLFQTHGFTVIPTGFLEHSFPVVFFKVNETALRAIPNRGSGGFEKSLSIHSLQSSSVTAKELENVNSVHKKTEQESLSYLYAKSLHQHQATGTEALHRIFQEKFSKKPQHIGNCTTVGGKAAVELILTAKKLQKIPDENFMEELEKILSDTNKQYKWFSLFTSLASLNALYKNANQNKIFFDPEAEELLFAKIEKKFEKLAKRFGQPPEIVSKKLESMREQSKTYRIEIQSPAIKEKRSLAAKKTIPIQAITEGNIAEIKAWIATGAALSALDSKGNTALHLAIANNQTEAALLLIENKIGLTSLNFDEEYPLFLAVTKKNQVIIDTLLEKTKPESYKSYRKQPLEVTFRTKNAELIQQFIHARFNSAAMLEIYSILKNRELFENCLQNGLDINAKNLEDKTLFDNFFEGFLMQINPQNVEQGKFIEDQTEILKKLSYLKANGLQWTAPMTEKVLESYQGLLNDSSPIALFLKANSQTS